MRLFISILVLISFAACKPTQQQTETKALEDLERGSYVAQSCRAGTDASILYDTKRIRAYGQNCGPNANGKSKIACDEVIESIKTLPTKYQLLLNKVGMSILVDSKSVTKGVTQSAFKADAVSIGNVSSFWTAAGSNGNNYLVTVVRVDESQDLKKEISYSVLRTLGDFFARGVFSLNKKPSGNGFVMDPTVTAAIPDKYIEAQAGLTKRFLSKVQNKGQNKLLMSIAKNDQNLLDNFPVQIKENIKARNIASFVTTEALHQYYCNDKMRAEFKTGRYTDLAFDLNQILAAIDAAVSTHVDLKISSQTDLAAPNGSLALTNGNSALLAQLFSFFQGFQTTQSMGAAAPNVDNTISKIPAPTNNDLAQQLANCGCTSCGGNCTCSGGNCTCASGGCTCSSGGACSCVGGCSCGVVG